MKLIQPFLSDTDKLSVDTAFTQAPDELSLTQQSFREETDINVIIARYLKSGMIPDHQLREPQFMDTTVFQSKSYVEHLQASIASNRAFSALPDDVRAKYPDADAWLASLEQQNAAQLHVDASGVVNNEPASAGAVSSVDPKPSV